MKYVLLIGDGMGDRPLPELSGQTPLEAAPTPNLDFMAGHGTLGLARTVPPGMTPGSDVAIMSLMGYNPKGVLTGRGPLEAASQGLVTGPEEFVFRLNLVTVREEGGHTVMGNHAAGNITTAEAGELVETLKKELPLDSGQRLFPGVSYRHLMTWPEPRAEHFPSWPPHDYRDQVIDFILDDPTSRPLMDLVRASRAILEDHPVNVRRKAAGLDLANAVWPWGQGLRPQIKTYQDRWGVTGATVSAVDLIRGLGVCTGLETLIVPGATGWLDTNYQGKVEAALKALERLDFVVIHLEAPDEASHQGNLGEKLKAISDFDRLVVGPMLEALPRFGPFRVLAACDHFTPLALKTHTADPVPFVLYSQPGDEGQKGGPAYNEFNAGATGLLVDPGAGLGHLLFGPEK